jgi:hypothetical protein
MLEWVLRFSYILRRLWIGLEYIGMKILNQLTCIKLNFIEDLSVNNIVSVTTYINLELLRQQQCAQPENKISYILFTLHHTEKYS